MIPSRSRIKNPSSHTPDGSAGRRGATKEAHIPDLESLLKARDYAGACALLQFKRHANRNDTKTTEMLAYCQFHYGDHLKALNLYKDLMQMEDCNPMVPIYAAACYYYMGMYKEAEESAEQGPRCSLQTRVLFHVAYKLNDEAKLLQYHQQLSDTIEDQLSLASIHYQRGHFQEATDIYKRLLLENREYMALNVYVALCYCKLDYYDVSMEILQVYLDKYKDSAVAVNLKACNTFRMFNGRAAEAELKQLQELSGGTYLENDLLRHNLVVFRGGEHALQYLPPLGDVPPEARLNLVIQYNRDNACVVMFILTPNLVQYLPPLGDVPPEARLNLVIHHLRHNDVGEALSLVKDLEPTSPQEYILKAVVHASIGQSRGSADNLKTAQQYFQLVGASSSECDTIPGRQCMASCFYLLKQFDDVLVFLQSIKSYFPNDDDFNWNYGMTKAAVGKFKEAEETLLLVQNEKYKSEYCYLSWLARCYIMNGRPRFAWELYLKMDTGTESYQLLQVIANDAYKMGAFFYAAKAFDVLERLDPAPEYLEGKKGGIAGTFQSIVAGKEPRDGLKDLLAMLRNSQQPEMEQIARVIRSWGQQSGAL